MLADEYEGEPATASGVDVGLLWQSPFSGAQMGLFLKNVYQDSKLPTAMDVYVGAGYRVGTQALLSVQYVRYDVTRRELNFLHLQHRWMIGGEAYLPQGLVLRAGREHKFKYEIYRDDRVLLSVGLGLRLEYRGVGLLLDYANRDGLGLYKDHRFSFACEY